MEITKTEIKKQIKSIDREYVKIATLLDAAQRRMGESFDKTSGVQARNEETVNKHRETLKKLEAQAQALEDRL